jgi:hypothetical protein
MKTSELTGAALDWAVAKCEGLLCLGYRTDGERFAIEDSDGQIEGFMPSTDWAQGGAIIERDCIQLAPSQGATYVECIWLAGNANENGDEFNGEGTTPLIAAMRCYVASKLGDEVEIPSELIDEATPC